MFLYFHKNHFLRFVGLALEFLIFRKNRFWKSYYRNSFSFWG